MGTPTAKNQERKTIRIVPLKMGKSKMKRDAGKSQAKNLRRSSTRRALA